jgi:hypothetical protein
MGYVPFSKAGSELLFEVVSRAYERQSLIVTTNLPFENWTEVCGCERLTGAMLDRLTHKVHKCPNAPLACKQMMDAMTADSLCSPSQGGKTPANTLHAAIGSEIKKKGAAARFEKVGRGQFGMRCQ